MMIEWRLGFNPAAIIWGPVVNLTPYNKFVIRIDVIPAIRRKLPKVLGKSYQGNLRGLTV
jgi:hypothetical protein